MLYCLPVTLLVINDLLVQLNRVYLVFLQVFLKLLKLISNLVPMTEHNHGFPFPSIIVFPCSFVLVPLISISLLSV